MRDYFALLPEYLARCAQRLDLCVGILAGVVFLLIAWVLGLGGQVIVTITVVIILFAVLEAGYSVYREERVMRAKRDAEVRLIASPALIRWNHPDPGPGRVRLEARIQWEIWTDIDINTANIGLNMIGFKPKKWWQIWKSQPTEKKLRALQPKGQDTFEYRKTFRASGQQPFQDSAEFEYEGPSDADKTRGLGLELVLGTGSPFGKYRAVVDFRLWERGSRKPL